MSRDSPETFYSLTFPFVLIHITIKNALYWWQELQIQVIGKSMSFLGRFQRWHWLLLGKSPYASTSLKGAVSCRAQRSRGPKTHLTPGLYGSILISWISDGVKNTTYWNQGGWAELRRNKKIDSFNIVVSFHVFPSLLPQPPFCDNHLSSSFLSRQLIPAKALADISVQC